MAKPGPAPRPPLSVVRDGNPGHRPVNPGVRAPLVEKLEPPDWSEFFPRFVVPRRPAPPRGKNVTAEKRLEHEGKLELWLRAKASKEAADRCRARAADEWRRVVPVLVKTAGLAVVDWSTVVDYCVCRARLDWCELQLSRHGLLVMGARGWCKNPLTTVAAQYRGQLKAYIGELGLSPSSRGSMTPPPGGDDDGNDAFD